MSGAVPCTEGRLWCSSAAAAAAVTGSLLPDQRRGISAATTSSCIKADESPLGLDLSPCPWKRTSLETRCTVAAVLTFVTVAFDVHDSPD